MIPDKRRDSLQKLTLQTQVVSVLYSPCPHQKQSVSMRRRDREESKQDRQQTNVNDSSQDDNSQDSGDLPLPDFILTPDQHFMIQTRLPKGFVLLPVSQSGIRALQVRRQTVTSYFECFQQHKNLVPKQKKEQIVDKIRLDFQKRKRQKALHRQLVNSKVIDVDEIDKKIQSNNNINIKSIPRRPINRKIMDSLQQKYQQCIALAENQAVLGRQKFEQKQQQGERDKKNWIKTAVETKVPKKTKKKEEARNRSLKRILQKTKFQTQSEQKVPLKQKFIDQFAILVQLKSYKSMSLFLRPVNEQKDGAPDYYKIIKEPMDLGTIQSKLASDTYKQPIEFHIDIEKMLNNSRIYNKNNKGMMRLTNQIQNYYEKVTKEVRKKNEKEKTNSLEKSCSQKNNKESVTPKKSSQKNTTVSVSPKKKTKKK